MSDSARLALDKREDVTIPEPGELARRQEAAKAWFEDLRDMICAAFERLERDLGDTAPAADLPPGRFERTAWRRPSDDPDDPEADCGGGVMSVMKGRVFEKVGVNVSTVYGRFSDAFSAQIPGAKDDKRFWASGISLVAHMRNPRVPAVHMNTRHLVTTKWWFGGGADLNPMLGEQRDESHPDARSFHAALKRVCDARGPEVWPEYKEWCDDYFFNVHRNEPRGVGGIFYDYRNTGDWAGDFAFTQDVGRAFLEVFPEIVSRHMNESYSAEEREEMLWRRGRYAEFNLVHDRGTKFGLMTGGNIDAILMSLPPEATWP